MLKSVKKKMAAVLAVVLLVTMIPVGSIFAEEGNVGLAAKEYFEDKGPGTYTYTNPTNAEDGNSSRFVNVVKSGATSQKMAHGNFAATFTVKADGTVDLTVSLDAKTRDITEIKIGDKTCERVSKTEHQIDGVTYFLYTFETITNFDVTTLTASVDKPNFTHRLNFASIKCTKINEDGTISDTTDNLSNAYAYLRLTDEELDNTNEVESGMALGVKIIRTAGSVTGKNNTEYNKQYFVSKVENVSGKINAQVTIAGIFSKGYFGTLEQAKAADTTGNTLTMSVVDGKTIANFNDIKIDTPVKLCLFSEHMGGWYEYTFTFYNAECDHTFENGICTKCGAFDTSGSSTNVTISAKEVAVKAVDRNDIIIQTSSFAALSGKTVELTTKVGTVTFDSDAIAAITGSTTSNIKLELKDLKNTSMYENTKYDMILDLSLTDAFGNALFTSGNGGKATITVPYDKTVENGKKVSVYYVTTSGKEAVDATYDATNKTVTFTVAHFSTYAIIQETESPATGDSSMLGLCIILMAVGTATAVTIVAKKKCENR